VLTVDVLSSSAGTVSTKKKRLSACSVGGCSLSVDNENCTPDVTRCAKPSTLNKI
jgi:hypothetical protein